MADKEIRESWVSLIRLLTKAIEERVHGIEIRALQVAAQGSSAPVAVGVPLSIRLSTGVRPQRSCGHLADFAGEVRDLQPAIPRHVTLEISGGLIGVVECRKNGRVSRFRFYSKAGGFLVVRLLADRHAISSIEEQALVKRMGCCSLPDWTESKFEPEVTFGSTSDDPSYRRYLLQRGEVITERQEWLM